VFICLQFYLVAARGEDVMQPTLTPDPLDRRTPLAPAMMGSVYAAEVPEHVVRHRRGSIAAGLDQWAKRQSDRQKQADRQRTKGRQEQMVASEIQRAESLTAKIEGRDAELRQILVNRPTHLQDRRAEVKRAYDHHDAAGMVEQIERRLAEAARPVDFPTGCQAAYEPEVRRLRVRYELPPLDATVSKNARFRYDKTERKPKPGPHHDESPERSYRSEANQTAAGRQRDHPPGPSDAAEHLVTPATNLHQVDMHSSAQRRAWDRQASRQQAR
jgi:hypothetical protein